MSRNFKNIEGILEELGVVTNFKAVVNNLSGAYLVDEVIKVLDDSSPLNVHIDINKKKYLIELLLRYSKSCGIVYMVENNLESYMDSLKKNIYSIDAINGVRIATKNEVEDGVRGLIANETKALSDEKIKQLNLLMWTVTGRLKYYSRAGFKYRYSEQNGLEDTIVEMIDKCKEKLENMILWVSDRCTFDNDISTVKKFKKNKYKYPTYAVDEIKETLSKKQILYYLQENLNNNRDIDGYKKAIALVLKSNNKYFKIEPLDMSFLRNMYYKLNDRIIDKKIIGGDLENKEVKDKCETLIWAKDMGYISRDHFVFKIITTIKSKSYSYCSNKQMNIIDEALNIAKSNKEKQDANKNSSTNGVGFIGELEIGDIYGDLGRGIL